MLFKYVILVTFVANSFSDNHLNEVEPSTVAYSDQRCLKTSLNIVDGEEEASPDKDEIGVYETYTLVCAGNFYLESGDKLVVDIDPVYTCMPGDETAELSPATPANCVDIKMQSPSKFATQVTGADVNSKYSVQIGDLSCPIVGQKGQLSPGDDMSSCTSGYKKYLDVGCKKEKSDYIFVGYHSLLVLDNQETSPWGQDILDDPLEQLKLYMACIPSDQADTVCYDVDTLPAKSDSKLFVKMYSAPVAAGDADRNEQSMSILQSSNIHYRLRCDNGYSFKNGIDDNTVYGYCSAAGTGEDKGNNKFFAYTKDIPDQQIICYSKCPANPDSTDTFAVGSSPVFGKLYLPSMKKDETFTLKKEAIECADGQALATDAQDTYVITCDGAETSAAANSGLLSCTDCPVCHAKCPANPTSADAFVSGETPVFQSLVLKELIKGETFDLLPGAVTCADGESLAEGAPDQYTITCSNDGKLSCGAQCPVCHPKCPANPTSADAFVSGETPVFQSLVLKELIKGETFDLLPGAVTCAEGYSLDVTATENYAITCSEDGKLSCGDQCPTCFPMCPENPNTEKFKAGSDIVFSQLTMDSLKKGQTHDLAKESVTCDANMALAADASASYTITCGEAAEGGEVGILECDTCPKCYDQCLANPTADKIELPDDVDSGIKSINIGDNQSLRSSITVNKEDVVCKDNYAMPDNAKPTFEFRCKEEGKYTCQEGENGCPQCKGTCKWPNPTNGKEGDEESGEGGDGGEGGGDSGEEGGDGDEEGGDGGEDGGNDDGNLGYDFRYVDESARDGDAIPGVNHVEAFCKNETHFAILGPRLLSCIKDSTMEFDTSGYPNDTKPTCQTSKVCESPATTGGTLDKTGNILVGETYTFSCSEGFMFDLDTQDKLREGETFLEITCVNGTGDALINTALPAQICYRGCKKTVGFDGEITPAESKSGRAPYSEGDTITFTCNDGYQLEDAKKAEQTCANGTIGTGVAPRCIKKEKPTEDPNGAAVDCFSLASTYLLTISVIAFLL